MDTSELREVERFFAEKLTVAYDALREASEAFTDLAIELHRMENERIFKRNDGRP
ncbi:MAG: hypothetical protein LBF93_07610 [Zoogloeaceae bacterium]|jgi:hypothetical protein|nr:hypothetical protein [Zoogloeaceae bacterium]